MKAPFHIERGFHFLKRDNRLIIAFDTLATITYHITFVIYSAHSFCHRDFSSDVIEQIIISLCSHIREKRFFPAAVRVPPLITDDLNKKGVMFSHKPLWKK
jgi:hypothetical protein